MFPPGEDEDSTSSDCREDAASNAVGPVVVATREPVVDVCAAAAENVDGAKASVYVEPDVAKAVEHEADRVFDPAACSDCILPVAAATANGCSRARVDFDNHADGIAGDDDTEEVLQLRDESLNPEQEHLEVLCRQSYFLDCFTKRKR